MYSRHLCSLCSFIELYGCVSSPFQFVLLGQRFSVERVYGCPSLALVLVNCCSYGWRFSAMVGCAFDDYGAPLCTAFLYALFWLWF
ncbi:unnamed protein product [Amaranthus hypochondriacus]